VIYTCILMVYMGATYWYKYIDCVYVCYITCIFIMKIAAMCMYIDFGGVQEC